MPIPTLLTLGFLPGNGLSSHSGYQNNNDYKIYYPTDVMETGADLIFFWVARMIMLGIYATGEVPFKTVYFHGMVRDVNKQKMSKSKGNVISPTEMIDKYGTDA